MENLESQLQQAKQRLISDKFREHWNFEMLATHLESLASMFARIDKEERRDLIAQFHNCAGRLPYVFDEDYGALVLEQAAENVTDHELRVWMLTEARFRATWGVYGATAGGEALGRALHLKRLDEKLQSLA